MRQQLQLQQLQQQPIKIGFLTSIDYPTLNHDDHILMQSCPSHFQCSILIWNDISIDWSQYDFLIIRSLWDYVHKFEEFQQWMKTIESMESPKLLNSPTLIRWNSNKVYLMEMNELGGIDVIPTVYVNQGDLCPSRNTILDFINYGFQNGKFPESQYSFVIKPSVGANGYGTYRFNLSNWQEYQSEFEKLLKECHVMIQPFVESVLVQGEYSFLYFNGKFSHSIIKKPCKDEFKVQEDHGGSVECHTASNYEIKASQKVIDYISKQICKPLYARIDMLLYNNQLCLGECELFEPTLYFMKDSKISDRFFNDLTDYISSLSLPSTPTICSTAASSSVIHTSPKVATSSIHSKLNLTSLQIPSSPSLSGTASPRSFHSPSPNASPRSLTPVSPFQTGIGVIKPLNLSSPNGDRATTIKNRNSFEIATI